MITPFDDAPKNAFLEKFQPKDGTTYRVYILDWNNKVELSFHYLEKTKDAAGNEIPGGMYTCDSAECCAILGAPSSKLMLPIWLYTSPDNDVNAGQLFSWDVPREQYKALVELKKKLASQNDNIANYDFQITAKDQGKGVRIQVMPLPPPRDPQSGQYYNGSSYLLLFATPEIRQQAFDSVAMWLTLADTTTFRKVPLGGWRGVLEKHHVPMIAGVGNVPMAGGQRAQVSHLRCPVRPSLLHRARATRLPASPHRPSLRLRATRLPASPHRPSLRLRVILRRVASPHKPLPKVREATPRAINSRPLRPPSLQCGRSDQ